MTISNGLSLRGPLFAIGNFHLYKMLTTNVSIALDTTPIISIANFAIASVHYCIQLRIVVCVLVCEGTVCTFPWNMVSDLPSTHPHSWTMVQASFNGFEKSLLAKHDPQSRLQVTLSIPSLQKNFWANHNSKRTSQGSGKVSVQAVNQIPWQ